MRSIIAALLPILAALTGGVVIGGGPAPVGSRTPYLHAPSVASYARHDPAGLTILPTGRYLKPVGRHVPLARWPHGLALSPDGKTLFVASEDVGQFVTGWDGPAPVVTPVVPGREKSTGAGAVFSHDGETLYWSSGDSGQVHVVDVATRVVVAEIPLNGPIGSETYADSVAMDLKLSDDGSHLYCADVTNFRLVVVDLMNRRVASSIRVGRYPYALAVVGRHVYVANVGMFAYTPIPKPTEPGHDPRGLTFPPYGFPSREARDGVVTEGRPVPGLGDPNVPESFSVWGVDVSDPARPRVVRRIKTGLLVGAPAERWNAVGGSGPNFLAALGCRVPSAGCRALPRLGTSGPTSTTGGAAMRGTRHSAPGTASAASLFVSNGNNDTIEQIDLATGKRVRRTRLQPSPLVAKLRGVGPAGMAVSPDGTRLYVAEMGINALGVLDTRTGRVLGHVPTAWYPYRVAVSPDGRRLAVICFRGFGNGPNGGRGNEGTSERGNEGTTSFTPSLVPSLTRPLSPFLGMKGSLSVLEAPTDAELPALTAKVLEYNGIVDRAAFQASMASPLVPTTPGKASAEIEHVVFITKENHTYDTIFDRVPGANDDPSLLRWGYHQRITGPNQPTLEDVAVMTNHNALARQFTVSDNFYVEPEASGVGHRWLVGIQPNNFCQMTYTLGWRFLADSGAPGRRVSFGSNGSMAPEDYPEAGSMWEHLARHGVSFRNYGEGFEFAGVHEDEDEQPTGAREVINMPMPKVLYDNTCREFPIFNMNIPDQYRADRFIGDFTKRFIQGSKPMPRFLNIAICNDHGTGPNPEKGYPYVASWMADNDLALGRIVEFLSHTPYWKKMAIFVTQDDAGGEPDHVDAQRSVLLVISPWAKRGYVSHRQTTIVSMHRTLYQILGLPPLNMFDALANDFSDCFTTTPNFRPYQVVPVDRRIFDPEKAKIPDDPEYRTAQRHRSILRDAPEEEERIEELAARSSRPTALSRTTAEE